MRYSHSFDMVISSDSNILILGSFPSVKSREIGFYYMHPMNRFWKVLSKLFDVDIVNASINDKKDFLKKNKIALYDVIDSCEIKGSSDATIKNVKVIDLIKILQSTKIEKIFLNGRKAYDLFIKHFPFYENMAYLLPSTSCANAQYSLDKLLEYWKVIIS